MYELNGAFQCPDLWNFKNSFFFAATIVTTVGYGNVTPFTTRGKIFTLVYAIIAIPFFGILLGKIGDYLMGKVDLVEYLIFGHEFETSQINDKA